MRKGGFLPCFNRMAMKLLGGRIKFRMHNWDAGLHDFGVKFCHGLLCDGLRV